MVHDYKVYVMPTKGFTLAILVLPSTLFSLGDVRQSVVIKA